MSPPWSKWINWIGRIRLPLGPSRTRVTVGDPNGPDALASTDWKRFARPEPLYDVWGPPPGSRWTPYHSVPLFAALDTLPRDGFGPLRPDLATGFETGSLLEPAVHLRPIGASWANERAWVILDLLGPQSVPLAVRFVAAGFQPVCTFDHWPHPAGLLKPEIILAQLLRHAGSMEKLRPALTPDAPPLWICDRARLGTRGGLPHEFDNRYYLDDSSLPAPEIIKQAGISQIICIVPEPLQPPRDDLRTYFRDLREDGFTQIHGVALNNPQLTLFEFPARTYDIKFRKTGYQRSGAGGFGQLIPDPGSGSS